MFLTSVNRDKYGDVITALNNDFVDGDDHYPEDITGMVNMLNNRRGGGLSTKQDDARQDGVIRTASFMMGSEAEFYGKDDKEKMQQKKRIQKANITCFKCGKKGHYKSECMVAAQKD